jgi:hypothetical protein
MGLEPLLTALADRRCFITWYAVPIPDKPGKFDKVPYEARPGLEGSGKNSSAQDPSTWLTAAEARAFAAQGLLVGIVITEGSGLFCVDLDGALQPDGTWSAFSQWALALFPGACVEVSHSGKSLHIIGSCARDFPEHRTVKRSAGAYPVEVYTRARFIALTGTHMAGNPLVDHTTALQQLIAHCLPEPVGKRHAEWTTAPYPGWRGGGTDDQIIAGQLNRAGAHAIFGNGASFRDLWEANSEALANAFPDSTGKNTWNQSAADQALANHLAWATGYDCERTLRLMWRSALRRDKWERDDYLDRTIRFAVAGKIPTGAAADDDRTAGPITTPAAVPTDPAPAAAVQREAPDPAGAAADQPGIPAPPAPTRRRMLPPPGSYITASEQPVFFDGCIYIEDMHSILMPDGSMLQQKQFDVHFGGFEFQMRTDGSKPTNSAWECFVDSFMVRQPRAHGVCFNPAADARAVIVRDGATLINSWVPLHVPMQSGDPKPFLDHLKILLPLGDDADILLAYMAAVMQYKGTKFQWAPFIQGVEGNGKSLISEVLEYCVGARYTHWPRADKIDKQFNAALYGKLLICVEDVKVSDNKASVWETMKPMITGTRLEFEPKGVDSKVSRDFCANWILNSNHQDGIRKTKNDRRICPFFCAQQYVTDLERCGLNEAYFDQHLRPWLFQQGGLQIMANFLNTYTIPPQWNPAGSCIRAPRTSSTEAALKASRGSIEQEVVEAVAEGRPGFRGGWISSIAFDNLLGEIGMSRKITRNKRGEILEGCGYHLHDGLPDGRVTQPLPDGTRPRLYTAPNVAGGLRDPAQIAAIYVQAQALTK